MKSLPTLAAFLILAAGLTGCGPLTFTIGGPTDAGIRSTIVQKDDAWTSNRVAIVDVTGLIVNAEQPGLLSVEENPVSALHEKLEAARRDDRVKAVLLRLNTPGGTVTASDAMYREVQRFREKSGKPVIAVMMDVAASGGYYVACAADEIVAYPTTITGSIGVIFQTISVKPGLDRIGIRTEALTSGPNKDAGSPLSVLTEEHRETLGAMVEDFYGRFVEVVRRGRPNIPSEEFDRVTDGRVVTGEAAEGLGLVDRTGDIYDAFEAAKERAGVDHAHLTLYHREGGFTGSAYAAAPASTPSDGATQINLAQFNLNSPLGLGGVPAAFLYLWRPELP